jgi:hypothetical protein
MLAEERSQLLRHSRLRISRSGSTIDDADELKQRAGAANAPPHGATGARADLSSTRVVPDGLAPSTSSQSSVSGAARCTS